MDRSLLVASVIASAGKIQGRVKLQKIIYLLQTLGYPTSYRDFVLHHYGPYSGSLANDVDYLQKVGFVNEAEEPRTNQRGEPLVRYDYSVPNEIQESLLQPTEQRDAAKFKSVVEKLAKQDSNVLELAATITYLQREEDLPVNKLKEVATMIKPNLAGLWRESENLLKELSLLAKDTHSTNSSQS